ncbi:MAG: hypothetical protein RLZZ21_86 [Planctomycetota bacterium]
MTGEEQSRFVFPQSMPPGSGFPRQAICTGINVLREEGLPLEQAILTYAAQRPVSRQAKQTGLVAKLAVAERRR